LEGFDDAIKEAWQCDAAITDPFRRLDTLFRNTAEALQAWGQKKTGNVKLQIAIANTLIFRLDIAQEARVLSPGERWLRRMLKHAVLGLSSLERTIARQRSRIRWLREGDANTKLFHVVANGRRTKNYIAAVRVDNEIVTEQVRKVVAFTNAFEQMLGTIETREHGLDLHAACPRLEISQFGGFGGHVFR
jgi:hypothetical protein